MLLRYLDWSPFVGTEVCLNWTGQAGGLFDSDFGNLVNKSNELFARITSLAAHRAAYVEERAGIDEDSKTIGVYVPPPESELADEFWRGSGVVGSRVGDN